MRIRKRFPQPLSVPDPQLHHGSVAAASAAAKQHFHGNLYEEAKTESRHSDPQNQLTYEEPVIETEKPICDHYRTQEETRQKQEINGDQEINDERWKKEEEQEDSSNYFRKENISSAEIVDAPSTLISSSSPHQEVVVDADKIVPLKKKRKGSFENEDTSTVKVRLLKSKTNKKCSKLQNGDDEEEKEESNTNYNIEGFEDHSKGTISSSGGAILKKNKTRGSVVMEGSRCSRVNGRGWRCCQKTLVGYSLCEHHLGKGRLISMTSVRRRAAMASREVKVADVVHEITPLSNLQEEKSETIISLSSTVNDDDEFIMKPLVMVAKKRVKLGAVKARSISSLLGQSDQN